MLPKMCYDEKSFQPSDHLKKYNGGTFDIPQQMCVMMKSFQPSDHLEKNNGGTFDRPQQMCHDVKTLNTEV